MRFCLRVGLVDVVDETLRQKLAGRQLLQPADEWSVRYAAYRAVEGLVAASRRSTGAVDYFMFKRSCSSPCCGRRSTDGGIRRRLSLGSARSVTSHEQASRPQSGGVSGA
jgi:hypothetical protein